MPRGFSSSIVRMSAPLSSDEWSILHQTMDRFDRQRWEQHAPRPVDREKIKQAALEAYRSQDMPVDTKALDDALDQTLATMVPPCCRRVTPTAWQANLLKAFRKMGWVAAGNLLGKRPQGIPAWLRSVSLWAKTPSAPATQAPRGERLDATFRAFFEHQPVEADGIRQAAVVGQGVQERRRKVWQRTAWVAGLSGGALLWLGQPWMWVGLSLIGVALQAVVLRWDATEKGARLQRVNNAIDEKQWDDVDLKQVVREMGVGLWGSLEPLSAFSKQWMGLSERCRGNVFLEASWKRWTQSPHLRQNEAALLAHMSSLLQSTRPWTVRNYLDKRLHKVWEEKKDEKCHTIVTIMR